MAATGTGFWQQALRWPWRRAPDAARDDAPRAVHPGEMPGLRIGGFPLVRTIAHGAMGELHLATDPATGQPLAVKTVRFAGSELTRDRFLRESAAAGRLQHPAIVATYSAGVDGQGDAAIGWIAMEWVVGQDLGRYTDVARLLPEALVLDLVIQLADALAHAHANGVVHRDIKPSNILVNLASGVVKLSDFGCAHLSDGERSRSGLIIGSPVYMAPEQLAGVPLDGRCDRTPWASCCSSC
jgi:serine/threonine protein kinase